jgi:hypothetical protein
MIVLCSRCGAVFRVMGDPDTVANLVGRNTEYWPNGYKCALCGGTCAATEGTSREVLSMATKRFELEPQEALMGLVAGLGLPEERELGDVKGALEGKTIDSVHGYMMGGRFVIEHLDVAGLRLFLAGSATGALVYRIKDLKKFEFTEKADGG